MIRGQVSPFRQATIALSVRGDSASLELDAVIDTGFTDFLTLPLTAIDALGLEAGGETWARLADGRRVRCTMYAAQVRWEEQWVDLTVLGTRGGALVGMSLLYGCDLRIAVIDGGEVTNAPLAG